MYIKFILYVYEIEQNKFFLKHSFISFLKIFCEHITYINRYAIC